MTTAYDPLAAARAGTNPKVLARMPSGWAVIGDVQRLPGYVLLLHDGDADQLTDLPLDQRVQFLTDMTILGQALTHACSRLDPGFRRVNYAVLGNAYGHLHAHLHARYDWEDADRGGLPVWNYPDRNDPRYSLSAEHDLLRQEITAELRLQLSRA